MLKFIKSIIITMCIRWKGRHTKLMLKHISAIVTNTLSLNFSIYFTFIINIQAHQDNIFFFVCGKWHITLAY